MGNSNSQQLHHQHHHQHHQHHHQLRAPPHQQQWAHSYPRTAPQNKVLPERIPGQRLRVTDNGAILHNGGTISGRRQSPGRYSDEEQQPSERYRSRSSSNHRHPPQQRQPPLKVNVKRFGSEPDLRNPSPHKQSPSKQRISRTRKKYKAPAPPPEGESHGPDSSSPDSYHWENLDPPARRLRLFKTREETKKVNGQRIAPGRSSSPEPPRLVERSGRERERSVPKWSHSREHTRVIPIGQEAERRVGSNHRATEQERNAVNVMRVKAEKRLIETPSIPRVSGHRQPTHDAHRSLSTPQFQAELLRAAQRLRPTVVAPPPAPAPPPPSAPRGDGSGRASTPDSRPPRNLQESHWDVISPRPTKTFYFGMEQGERDAVDRFAASIHRLPAAAATSGSGDSLSSDIEGDDELDGSIALQLRPMLPKKQLEIPRFSPTAAWRLLSALESPATPIDEPPVLLEERIQRLSRPMAPPLPQMLQAPRSSHDKSGDSGISGDASPGGCHEDSSEAPLASPPIRQPLVAAWTPQQDLGEESSSDGGGDDSMQNAAGTQPKFSPRAQVFSLSLPRDERLCLALYSENNKTKKDVQPSFNSLKKLKRSVSGAFTALNTPTKVKEDDRLLDENWLLSRSAGNSLNSGNVKPTSSSSNPSTPDHDQSQRASFSYLASGGHVMYLPEYKSRHGHAPDRSHAGLRSAAKLSKSCENISASEMRQLDRTPSPDMMDARDRLNGFPEHEEVPNTGKRGKNRRFTFQSTVRQIERRRISERLSRDAELKERRRLGELEAMRRVEEEFQRKRAPEKANIRHQLRLFNLDEQLFSSLPNGWADTARAEPDGATSSTPSSSTPKAGPSPDPAAPRPLSTQVLSEFREPRRDYREYRPTRFTELGPESMPEKRATVHPPAVFDMPKTTPVYVAPHRASNGVATADDRGSTSSDNYRRDFAHGALRSPSSDSELSQPNTRPTSRQQSRSPSPALPPRSRSAEPSCSSEDEDRLIQDHQMTATSAANVASAATEASAKRLCLTSVQPFAKNNKGYRPIAFNLGATQAQNVAQLVI